MGGWGEEHRSDSTGTTAQIADAHAALNEAGIDPGPLAMRAWKAARKLKAFKDEETKKCLFITDL